MKIILHSSSLYVLGAIVLIGIALTLLLGALTKEQNNITSTFIERGNVMQTVSVSGVVEADNSAALAFAVSGVVAEVLADEGMEVQKGDILARLISSQLLAERQSALADVQKAMADKEELLAGPTTEARNVTDVTVLNAEATLTQVTNEEDKKVANAYRALLSNDLTAYSTDSDEDATAPSISGTYTCETEGVYTLALYNSAARSGYSYNYSGIESGTDTVFTDTADQLGSCGLLIIFTEGERYHNSEWEIPIPNKNSASYQTLSNAYTLAQQQREKAIAAAQNALRLAQEEATLDNAAPRGEAILRANAAITSARARVASIDAQIADRTITAPFSGTITDVTILPGETAGTAPVITLLNTDTFDLTARIPEIDITKIEQDQPVAIIFDAHSSEVITGTIEFISPLATEIDGVAYFEAIIQFDTIPAWLRSGLNADIEIIVERRENVLRLPARYLDSLGDTVTVEQLTASGDRTHTEITIDFVGNDGYAAITGLPEGAEVITPKID